VTNSTVKAAVISRPPWRPNGDSTPNTPGKIRSFARLRVSPAEAYSVAVTDEAVARSAATAISTNPASPRVGLAASAIAVGP
jgi:hypothetical protein